MFRIVCLSKNYRKFKIYSFMVMSNSRCYLLIRVSLILNFQGFLDVNPKIKRRIGLPYMLELLWVIIVSIA